MLNIKPGAGIPSREDLPIFQASATFSQPGGTYYLAQGSLVSNPAAAAIFDNAGDRRIRGCKVYSGLPIPGGSALSVAPYVSTDDGGTWTPLSSLEVALAASTKRGSLFLTPSALVTLADSSLLVYRVLLTNTVTTTLNVGLFLY